MDVAYRELERRALSGDRTAIELFRRRTMLLNSTLNRFPDPVIRVLAGYGYQPARNMLPRQLWPNSTSQAFDILYHEIPHNAHTAAVIRYRVLAPAYERMIRRPKSVHYSGDLSVRDTLNSLNTESWEFQLQDRSPEQVVENAISLVRQMTQENYYDNLCIVSARDYNQNQIRGTFGNYRPEHPLVIQHDQAKKNCVAVGNLLTDQRSVDSSIPQHLDRAIYSLADAVGPKLVGFDGVHNLDQMLHGVRYFLDQMDYSWSNNAHVEAVWSYYLI